MLAAEQLCSDVRQIDLLPHGEQIAFEPGGHIDVHLSLEEGVQTRSYSHVAIGPQKSLRIAVKLLPDSRSGSRFMWGLALGDSIDLSPARNDFPLSYGAEEYALLAGGIGITPIIAHSRALKSASRRFSLHYCVRNASDAP